MSKNYEELMRMAHTVAIYMRPGYDGEELDFDEWCDWIRNGYNLINSPIEQTSLPPPHPPREKGLYPKYRVIRNKDLQVSTTILMCLDERDPVALKNALNYAFDIMRDDPDFSSSLFVKIEQVFTHRNDIKWDKYPHGTTEGEIEDFLQIYEGTFHRMYPERRIIEHKGR